MNSGNLRLPSAFYTSVNPRSQALCAPVQPVWEVPGAQAGQRRTLPEVDADTLARARGGDRAAQEDFVRLYERRVHAFLGRSLLGATQVDDLAQEVFLRVLRALPRFEPRDARVSTWIFSIAVHLLADQHRRRFRWFGPLDEARQPAAGQSPEERAMARETLTEVERALLDLSAEQRMTLALFEFHDLSHEEVAVALSTSVATVKTRLFRARRSLRRSLRRIGASREGGVR